jgi:hypothetical protein
MLLRYDFPFLTSHLMKKLTLFFLVCSGANLALLENSPTEKTKYAGLGATVFFTGFFAFLSSAYALYTVFDSVSIAILLGLAWGAMIFNLDRYIVSGMRKEGRPWRELLNAVPRIILAILISIVIAKPLELRIFEKEIQPELAIMEQKAFAKEESEVRSRFKASDDKLRGEVGVLSAQLQERVAKRDDLKRIAQEEADGTGGSKKKNLGPIYKVKKADADLADQELQRLTVENSAKIKGLEKRIWQNDSAMQVALKSLSFTKRDGLAARIEALSNIKAQSDPIRYAGIFIVLLFIALETSPVFVKLIANKGPYDNLLRVEEHGFFTRETEAVASASADVRRKSGDLPEHESNFSNERLDQALKKI